MSKENKEVKNQNVRGEIDLKNLFRLFLRRWRLIISFTAGFTLFTLIVCFIVSPVYRSTAVIIPIERAMPSFIDSGGLTSLIGLLAAGSGSSSSKIMAIMQSNSIKERIIVKHNLMKVFFDDEWDERGGKWRDEPPHITEGIRELEDLVKINKDRKTGAISISADFQDPNDAAKLANWFIEELNEILKEKSFSMARHHRENMEEIIGSLKGHLKVPPSDLTDFSEFMRRMQDLEISEKAYQELLVEYYLARFQETKEDVVFQVIDEAKPQDEPERPKKLLYTLIGMVFSFILVCSYTLVTNKEESD